MSAPASEGESGSGEPAWFVTTHWSVVLRARDGASVQSDDALEKLCLLTPASTCSGGITGAA